MEMNTPPPAASGPGGIPGFTLNLSNLPTSKSKAVKSYAYIDGKKVLSTQAKAMWLNLTPDEQKQIMDFTAARGMRISQAKTVWGQLVDASAQSYAAGQLKTPWQILQEQQGNQPTTYTTTQKEMYDPVAQAPIIHAAAVKWLGRLANQDDINDIIAKANAQAGTVNRTTYGTGGAVTQSSPDLTPEQIASSEFASDPKYQAERGRMQNLSFASWINQAITGGSNAAGGLLNG
jgi:hypothetical protein